MYRCAILRFMTIEMKKIGTVLDARPEGREAFLGIRPTLPKIQGTITLDFRDVDVLTPSFADEFISPLVERFPGNVHFCNTSNSSVRQTLEFLAEGWPKGTYTFSE